MRTRTAPSAWKPSLTIFGLHWLEMRCSLSFDADEHLSGKGFTNDRFRRTGHVLRLPYNVSASLPLPESSKAVRKAL
jgi:hypothetical protein